MSRVFRRGASCRLRYRSAAGCRRFIPALGRIMFGYLDEAEIWRRLKSQRIEAYTPQTITDLQALFDRIRADHEQRFSIVDEELERGLRALAVPVRDRAGQAVGAINLSTHSTRTTRNEMRERFLPELNRIADPARVHDALIVGTLDGSLAIGEAAAVSFRQVRNTDRSSIIEH